MTRIGNAFLWLIMSAVCLLIIFPARICAQAVANAQISGTVTDPSGAIIPDAIVTEIASALK